MQSPARAADLCWARPCSTSIVAVRSKERPARSTDAKESAGRGRVQAHRSRYLFLQATSKKTIPTESTRASSSQPDLPSPAESAEEIIAPAKRMRFPEKPRRTEMHLTDQIRCTSFQAFSAARRDTKLPRSMPAAKSCRAD